MTIASYLKLYNSELSKLKTEIELYENEKNIWICNKNIANSGGNLCLHLIGNLNHFIGHVLGKTNYVRNRDLEFSQKDVLKKHLIDSIDETIYVLNITINNLMDDDLQKEYPDSKFENKETIEFLLIYLLGHLTYHIGQINYHRRLLDN